ncbi:threonine--tRNA ligase, partial [Bacillus siamensis]
MKKPHIVITFPDGKQKEYQTGVTLEEIAQSISLSLKKTSAAGKVNGSLYDLRRSIHEDAEIELCSFQSEEGLGVMRHTAAHVLAQAVKRLYPKVCLGIGPVIENGFYYDFDMDETITERELAVIEKEMNRII